MNTATQLQPNAVSGRYRPNTAPLVAEQLTEDQKQESLEFLARRPLHTVIMAGWIREHGVVSPLHRGTFYSCRDADGNLVGVALIGVNTLFEVSSNKAVKAFAECAGFCHDIQMVFAQEEELAVFWNHYRGSDPMPELSRHQLITSSDSYSNDVETLEELRTATRSDLDQIVAAHAEMVFEETGIDPLKTDADGFRSRCSRRVEKGKVWVWIKDGELIFKTDILSVTPEATYIEGLWVNPKERGKGNSTRGMTSLCQRLLTGSNAICGFLDEAHDLAHSLYRKSGFTSIDTYAKIYL